MGKHVPSGESDALARVTAYLVDIGVIGNISKPEKYKRGCTLCSSNIFSQLVTVYTSQFRIKWPRLKQFMQAFPHTGNTTPWAYAARIYISGWFHDLYVSNREAVKKMPSMNGPNNHYAHEEAYCSLEYDEFLTRLNAAIRPTHIQGTPEDTLFVPLMADKIDWDHPTSNWFGITNFTFDYDCLLDLIHSMKQSRIWRMSTLVKNTTGRPSWLFDWHSDNRCCAWFPEGNYDMDDVSMAYMVGVACTPHLGPCDRDDWQPVQNGDINPSSFERVTERRFFGVYEVRTLEVKTYNYFNAPPCRSKYKCKAKSSGSITFGNQEPSAADTESTKIEVVQETPYFQISDWTYYAHLRAPNVECTNFS